MRFLVIVVDGSTTNLTPEPVFFRGNHSSCARGMAATATASLARGTFPAARHPRGVAARAARLPARRVAAAVRAAREDSPSGDDDDELARRAEMTYADLPSVPGGSVLDCSRAFTVDIPPAIVADALPDRGVLQYVRLPAEEYNVLDSSAVERIDVGTFRVNAGTQKILMWEIEPVGTLRIVPTDNGCEQILLGAVMNDVKARRTGKESVVIRAMNASLKDLTMRNAVSAVAGASGTEGTAIRCQIDVAGTFTEGPFAAAGSQRLCAMLDWCLRSVLPWFLEQLAADYADWASGRARGKRTVNVTQVAGEILAGGKGQLPPGVAESAVERR